ncbi:MAG: CPBP family intramembrane metalloprotease [Bacteroidetes bacterium]|nr:CPBP family intramembrane metalloprotease [Bacteroidota bacterium]
MIKSFLELLLHLVVIIPLAIGLMNIRSRENYMRLALFSVLYIINQLALSLPNYVPAFDFIGGNWNWDGKVLGLVVGILSVILFKNHFNGNNFFTLRQNPATIRSTVVAVSLLTITSLALSFFMGNQQWDTETLIFEFTMPSIEEEIMFRGVLLGLLSTVLKPSVPRAGNPSVLITALLFGFVHAFGLTNDYSIHFDPFFFLMTALAGYVWGWVTVKSRSILLAYLSHNVCNWLGTLLTML